MSDPLIDDMLSIMSDIVMYYDTHGDLPHDWLNSLELTLHAYFEEYGNES